MPTTIVGRCHCHQVEVSLTGDGTNRWPARACGCDYCRASRLTWTSVPTGRARITSPSLLGRYRFGTQTADFLFCPNCSQNVAAVFDQDGLDYAVLNVALFALPERFNAVSHSDFSGETVDERLARRTKAWTPVTVVEDNPEPSLPG